jgi:hypothetical protein
MHMYIYTYIHIYIQRERERVDYRFIWLTTSGRLRKIMKIRVPWKTDNFDKRNDH